MGWWEEEEEGGGAEVDNGDAEEDGVFAVVEPVVEVVATGVGWEEVRRGWAVSL